MVPTKQQSYFLTRRLYQNPNLQFEVTIRGKKTTNILTNSLSEHRDFLQSPFYYST